MVKECGSVIYLVYGGTCRLEVRIIFRMGEGVVGWVCNFFYNIFKTVIYLKLLLDALTFKRVFFKAP